MWRAQRNLHAKYDVILFGPIGGVGSQQIVDGLPMWGNPMPWKTTKLTPNIGNIDSTDDIRPGLGAKRPRKPEAVRAHAGGLLITAEDTAKFAIDTGMAPGVFVTPTHNLKVVGSVLQANFSSIAKIRSPAVTPATTWRCTARWASRSPSPTRSPATTACPPQGLPAPDRTRRPARHDTPKAAPRPTPGAARCQALAGAAAERRADAQQPAGDSQPISAAGDPALRRCRQLLIAGLLDGPLRQGQRRRNGRARRGGRCPLWQGQRAAVRRSNPIWRGETIGSYPLVFNALITPTLLVTPRKPIHRPRMTLVRRPYLWPRHCLVFQPARTKPARRLGFL
jgi:hypothetical protein